MRLRLRRVTALLAVLLLAAAPASAQPFFTPGQVAGGVLGCQYASVSISNSVQASTLYSLAIPTPYAATSTLTPTLSATTTGWNWTGSTPLHLRLLGTLRTNPGHGSPYNVNMGVNYGGSAASIALVNAHAISGSLVDAPWRADVYILPYASGVGANTVRLWGEFQYATRTDTPLTPGFLTNPTFYAYTIGTTSLQTGQTATVAWQWGSGSQTNSINLHSACWKLAE